MPAYPKRGAVASWTNATAGAQSSRIRASRGAGSPSPSGTNAAPVCNTPSMATAMSAPRSRNSVTRSPGPAPASASRSASRCDRSISSR